MKTFEELFRDNTFQQEILPAYLQQYLSGNYDRNDQWHLLKEGSKRKWRHKALSLIHYIESYRDQSR